MKNHDYCQDSDEAAQLRKEKDDLAFELGQADAQLAALRARVAELEGKIIGQEEQLKAITNTKCGFGGYLDEIHNEQTRLEQRNAELVSALADMTGYIRAMRTDNKLERDGVIYAIQTMEYAEGAAEYCDRAEVLLYAHDEGRSESATPAKAQCQFCGSELLWSEDRGAHCDGCGAEPDLDTPAPRADTVRLDWLFANTIIAAPDGHVIDCREDLDAAMKGGAND